MHFSTKHASNKLTYKFKVNNIVNMLANLFAKQYSFLRQIKCEDVEAIIIFVNAISKTRYN
jgi:hypothetical protein